MMPAAMMGGGVPQPAPQEKSASSSTSSSSSEEERPRKSRKKHKKDAAPRSGYITTSATYVMDCPRTRKSELIEFVHAPFDACMTADVPSDALDLLIWFLTEIRPCAKTADLRSRTWQELYAKAKTCNARVVHSMTEPVFHYARRCEGQL
mmetsp:Transcript_38214/g.57145  ORF Transcript_38214/g.57145 Transcript_38214/m.57145 type:complete len:150 (-) Transcript_38214:77-526(-)